MDLQYKILEAVEKKKTATSVFLDFAKAFDTVNHSILLDRLKYYGVRGLPLRWFQSYLLSRPQQVEVNGTHSDVRYIEYRIPQGSILGPLLFLIYH